MGEFFFRGVCHSDSDVTKHNSKHVWIKVKFCRGVILNIAAAWLFMLKHLPTFVLVWLIMLRQKCHVYDINEPPYAGIILCMGSANEGRLHIITSSLIGRVNTENGPCGLYMTWTLIPSGIESLSSELPYTISLIFVWHRNFMWHVFCNNIKTPWAKKYQIEIDIQLNTVSVQ